MEEVEHLKLKWAELRFEDLDDLAAARQVVALDVVEDLEHTRRRRRGAVTKLGIEGDAGKSTLVHRGPDLAFDQRLDELREEVAGEQRWAASTSGCFALALRHRR